MSSSVFDTIYADAYDALYRDKDYDAECSFLEQLFSKYAQSPIRTILDLGCGTGGHALPLTQRGYEVVGVDKSEEMLALARAKARSSQSPHPPTFVSGDIRDVELGRTFDVVIAMFAVMSYQTTNEDLLAAFRTARWHLKPGRLFVFDAWFGPAVLTERPMDRYKVVERDDDRIIRFAHPILDALQHTVQVNYRVLRLKHNHVLEEVEESHVIRFLFPQEVRFFLAQANFQVLEMCPFMVSGKPLSPKDWNFTVVAQAVDEE